MLAPKFLLVTVRWVQHAVQQHRNPSHHPLLRQFLPFAGPQRRPEDIACDMVWPRFAVKVLHVVVCALHDAQRHVPAALVAISVSAVVRFDGQ
eukprot:458680-Rhodomonas_salina.1